LPVYNKPLIYYPLSIAMLIGFRDIVLVVNKEDLPTYQKLLGIGERWGIHLHYVIQEAPLGLAHGLLITAPLLEGENVCLILGDNILFGHGLPELLKNCANKVEKEGGAYVFAYRVHDPERYGVVIFDSKGNIKDLEEKPSNPRSHWAIVGLYLYDKKVWHFLKEIKPSGRGEYEITALNKLYLKEKALKAEILGRGYTWFDAGTPESLQEASEFVAIYEKRSGRMLASLEEIALRQGWISAESIQDLCAKYKNSYTEYLLELIKNWENTK